MEQAISGGFNSIYTQIQKDHNVTFLVAKEISNFYDYDNVVQQNNGDLKSHRNLEDAISKLHVMKRSLVDEDSSLAIFWDQILGFNPYQAKINKIDKLKKFYFKLSINFHRYLNNFINLWKTGERTNDEGETTYVYNFFKDINLGRMQEFIPEFQNGETRQKVLQALVGSISDLVSGLIEKMGVHVFNGVSKTSITDLENISENVMAEIRSKVDDKYITKFFKDLLVQGNENYQNFMMFLTEMLPHDQGADWEDRGHKELMKVWFQKILPQPQYYATEEEIRQDLKNLNDFSTLTPSEEIVEGNAKLSGYLEALGAFFSWINPLEPDNGMDEKVRKEVLLTTPVHEMRDESDSGKGWRGSDPNNLYNNRDFTTSMEKFFADTKKWNLVANHVAKKFRRALGEGQEKAKDDQPKDLTAVKEFLKDLFDESDEYDKRNLPIEADDDGACACKTMFELPASNKKRTKFGRGGTWAWILVLTVLGHLVWFYWPEISKKIM